MTVSVALAAYNGEKYIREQIGSILPQLSGDDEIVVSLDPSDDGTGQALFSLSDSRIRVVTGEGKGLIKNFENAIKHCKNELIFLSDQDDVWIADKVRRVKSEFEADEKLLLVMHDAIVTDAQLNTVNPSFFAVRGTRTGIIKNIIKNSYMGCCMAFRREALEYLLPFPDNLPMHDQWIGLVCEKHGRVKLIDEPLILWRRHGDNSSKLQHEGFAQMLKWRLSIIADLAGKG